MRKFLTGLLVFLAAAHVSVAQETKPQVQADAVPGESKHNVQTASISFSVLDMADKPRTSEKITITGQKTKKAFTATTDAGGKATVLVPKGDTYSIRHGNVEHNPITIPESGSGKYEYTIKSESAPHE